MVSTQLPAPAKLFRALSDEQRLRLLMVVEAAELSVAEMTEVLELPQSTVSRQLAPLRELGLVEARKEGTWTFYSAGELMKETAVRAMLKESFAAIETRERDMAALQRVLEKRRKRSRDYFDERAGYYGHGRAPGGTYEALARALAAALRGRRVADLGCGEGALSLMLARAGAQVTAVDSSPAMIRFVKRMAKEQGVQSLHVAHGDLEKLPLEDASVDFVILSQALHHAARPQQAIAEAVRVLTPGGSLVVLDLMKHDKEEMRMEFGDYWLGFEPAQLATWLEEAKLQDVHYEKAVGEREPSIIIVTAYKA